MAPKRKSEPSASSSADSAPLPGDQSKTYYKVDKQSPKQRSTLLTVIEAIKIESGLFMVEPWEQVLATAVFLSLMFGLYKVVTMLLW
jgi:hypothetical protein